MPCTASATFQDVELTFTERPLRLNGVTASSAQWQTDGSQLLSTQPLLGQVLIGDTQSILISPNAGLSNEHLLTLILGSGLASSLYVNSAIPLHGAAICSAKGALLFLGASGRGKSTIALTAASAGWDVLTDDVISLQYDANNQQMMVYPAHNRFKAHHNAAQQLGYSIDLNATTAPGSNKHPCYVPNTRLSMQPKPIVAIYFIENNQHKSLHCLTSLNASLGLEALRNQCYRPGLIKMFKQRKQLFRQNALISQQVKFYKLWLPDYNHCGGIIGYRDWLNDFLISQTTAL